MSSLYTVSQTNGGNAPYFAQAPSVQQGLENKLEQSEPMLTIKDVAAILGVNPEFVRNGLDGLPEQLKDVRGDGSYFVHSYYLSDVVSFLEKARGQPLPDGPLEPLLTSNEVAKMLSVHRQTVYNWGQKGILPAYQLGPSTFRYDRRDVEAIAEKLTTNQVAEMLHVNPATVYLWVNKGILTAIKLGSHKLRYDPRDVEAFAERLTTNEVAEMLHVHPDTIMNWRNKGILPAYQLGPHTFRYDPRDVEAFAGKRGIKIDSV